MEKYAGTQAIARTFQLIKLFDDENPIWSLPRLIESSGLKRTTAFRLLAALEAEGIVRRTANGDYTLGPALILMGGRAIRANPLRTIAQPFLYNLVQQTAESVTLDVLWVTETGQSTSMVIEEKLGQHVLGMSQYIGARFPAHTTSTGKVLLAFQTDAALAQLNLSELAPFTDETITTIAHLQAEFDQIRRQGFATTRNELEIGLAALAAPIFNHHGEVQAALCIAGPSSRLTEQRVAELCEVVVETAVHISTHLGATPP